MPQPSTCSPKMAPYRLPRRARSTGSKLLRRRTRNAGCESICESYTVANSSHQLAAAMRKRRVRAKVVTYREALRISVLLFMVASLASCSGPANSAPPASFGPAATPTSQGFHLTPVLSQSAGQDTVETVAFSPEGQRLAIGLAGGTVAIFALNDPSAEPVVSQLHPSAVSALAWSPDGAQLLSAATNGSVHLSDSATLQVLRSFNAYPQSYPAVAWSPDGSQFALA